jgi:hypothetical protein
MLQGEIAMYADPSDIKRNVIKPKFNDRYYAVVVALARLNNRPPATLVHDLVIAYIESAEKQANGEANAA